MSRESFPINVLVDSGADDSFIDIAKAEQANIPVEALEFLRTVNALNGKSLYL